MECRTDLGGVMCIVINDGDAVYRALNLEATVGSGKGSKGIAGNIRINTA